MLKIEKHFSLKKLRILLPFSFCLLPFTFCLLPLSVWAETDLALDTADPMFLNASGDLLSRTGLDYSDEIVRLSQYFSYGLTPRFALSLDGHYQQDFDSDRDADGFSNVGVGGIYRLSTADEDTRIISDALFGVRFGGARDVRSPEFADTVYYAGLRVGRVWSGVTLATTIKTSWIFDDIRGMAYIDLLPEIYFRLTQNWSFGADANLRIATKPDFDEQYLGGKLVRRFGRTQYIAFGGYEFEQENFRMGLKVNILF